MERKDIINAINEIRKFNTETSKIEAKTALKQFFEIIKILYIHCKVDNKMDNKVDNKIQQQKSNNQKY